MPETVLGRDIAGTIEALYLDPACDAGFDVVWDGRQITSLLLERDDTQEFVRVHAAYAGAGEPGREIILVSRNLDFVMARMYALQARSLSHKTYVLRTVAEVEVQLQQRETPESVSA